MPASGSSPSATTASRSTGSGSRAPSASRRSRRFPRRSARALELAARRIRGVPRAAGLGAGSRVQRRRRDRVRGRPARRPGGALRPGRTGRVPLDGADDCDPCARRRCSRARPVRPAGSRWCRSRGDARGGVAHRCGGDLPSRRGAGDRGDGLRHRVGPGRGRDRGSRERVRGRRQAHGRGRRRRRHRRPGRTVRAHRGRRRHRGSAPGRPRPGRAGRARSRRDRVRGHVGPRGAGRGHRRDRVVRGRCLASGGDPVDPRVRRPGGPGSGRGAGDRGREPGGTRAPRAPRARRRRARARGPPGRCRLRRCAHGHRRLRRGGQPRPADGWRGSVRERAAGGRLPDPHPRRPRRTPTGCARSDPRRWPWRARKDSLAHAESVERRLAR